LCLLALSVIPHGLARAGQGLTLLPSECTLDTPESTQRLLVQRTAGGEVTQQLTRSVAWSSSDPDVARVVDGVVTPRADGEAVVTAKVGEQTATAKVVVTGMGRPF